MVTVTATLTTARRVIKRANTTIIANTETGMMITMIGTITTTIKSAV